MNEQRPKLSYEPNLALERQEAVKIHNELLKENEGFSEEEKKWDVEKNTNNNPKFTENSSQMMELRKKVGDIDTYRKLATSTENMDKFNMQDVGDIEKMKTEKARVDQECERIQREIQSDMMKLNELRARLGMEPSEDIPSLMDKKKKLEDLTFIKDDLELKLKEKEQQINIKEESDSEEYKLEIYHLKNSLEEVASNLRPLMGELRDREGMGMNQVFDNENLIGSAMQDLESLNDKVNLSEYLNKLNAGFNIDYRGRGRFSENTDSLRKIAHQLDRVYSSLELIPSKIKNEQERNEIGSSVNKVKNSIEEAKGFLLNKANQVDSI